ncbi:Bzip transcription factor [Phytophthora megakarya]|uniref:Bzip transcription factor n=1 Tax=Phytophthora megakarya TaxID=4795 RepID=A0A225VN86_9STRA|nr:Bzip transcription factor [Phytophthora megakarya]
MFLRWCKTASAATLDDVKLQSFLQQCCSPNVVFGDASGIDALMAQLRHYTRVLGNSKLQPQRIESMTPGIFAATASLEATVTELTFSILPKERLPRIDDYHISIRERLLGQKICCSCKIIFVFDDKNRVERLDVSIDLVSSLFQILWDLDLVANLLATYR